MERKNKIIDAALDLFASQGYNAVSTSRIAQHAGVSEGLIFRHFRNKKGLLEAVLDLGIERALQLYEPIMSLKDPKEVLKKYIELPYTVADEEYDFWKLQFKLKWEMEFTPAESFEPIFQKLLEVFKALGYSNPAQEARLMIHIVEGIAGGIIKEGKESQLPLKEFLIMKYNV